MCWRSWRWTGAVAAETRSERKPDLSARVGSSRGLAKVRAVRSGERVTLRIAFVAEPRRTALDLPPGRIVPARRAAHHHAIAFEVHDRIMTAHAAQNLAEAADGA